MEGSEKQESGIPNEEIEKNNEEAKKITKYDEQYEEMVKEYERISELEQKEIVDQEDKDKVWREIVNRICYVIDEIPSNINMKINEKEELCLKHSKGLSLFLEDIRKELMSIKTGMDLHKFSEKIGGIIGTGQFKEKLKDR